jgi:hypothetical protein
VPYITSAKTDGIAHPQVALTSISIEHQKHKKASENLAHFSSLENVVQPHHVSHAIHHNHTTKTPHQSLTFFKNPANTTHHHAQKK